MENHVTGNGLAYLEAAESAWRRTAQLRAKRERNKNFTYGNQWCDLATNHAGKTETEYEALKSKGKEPLTNNLIRQLVKSVIGRFRETAGNSDGSLYWLIELDCRALEEFLISRCCFQRVETGGSIANVSPAMMFFNEMTDPLGRDCDFIGQLHDMTIAAIISRLADGNRRKAAEICGAYGIGGNTAPSTPMPGCAGFYGGNCGEKLRVIETWTLESRECYECHDRAAGRWFTVERGKEQDLGNGIEKRWTLRKVWRCRWITPDGIILSQYDSPYHDGSHPFAFKLYPLIDGEVHSLVEDVIDQQKYVNRLITLVDHIMGASAKGVLLFPDNLLPEGYTWNDLRFAWAQPDAVIPYHPRNNSDKPQQVVNNATNIGAYEMLNLQMKLFEQISGVSGVLQGQSVSSSTGLQLYESQIRNATIALSDILESFNSFRLHRDKKIQSLKPPTADADKVITPNP